MSEKINSRTELRKDKQKTMRKQNKKPTENKKYY